jgi:Domain of unknown function (DUF4136)
LARCSDIRYVAKRPETPGVVVLFNRVCVAYPTTIGSEKQLTSYNTGWSYGPDWGSWLVYVGQLDLSMYDSRTKQLVWRGTASKTLDPKAKPEKKQENINKVVKKLLKDFPPKPKQ